MTHKWDLVLVLALALAGCDDRAATRRDETPSAQTNSDTKASQSPAQPHPGRPVGPSRVAPEPTPANQIKNKSIPIALQGRWGMVTGDCTTTKGDAKGLLLISANKLHFYESRGTLRDVVEESPTRLVGNFAFTGEGMEWTRRILLERSADSVSLVRRDYGDSASPGPYHYTRCKE